MRCASRALGAADMIRVVVSSWWGFCRCGSLPSMMVGYASDSSRFAQEAISLTLLGRSRTGIEAANTYRNDADNLHNGHQRSPSFLLV